MATTFSGALKMSVSGTLSKDVDIGSLSHNISYAQSYTLTNGTSANQANMMFTDTRTINASSSEDLDLAGGLTDPFGTSIVFTRIKGIIICANSGNTNNVVVGGDATSTFLTWVGAETDSVIVRPGGMICLMAPDATSYAVTATTGDLLKISNSGATTGVTYDIILLGTV